MSFSKNRELATLKQHGFLNEKSINSLYAFFLRRKANSEWLLQSKNLHFAVFAIED